MNRPSSYPQIAAVIATYNRAQLLNRTLESLAVQSLPRTALEIVIVDDGSSDDTRAICELFAQVLPIRYVYQRNAGLASARNHGLFLSTAPVVLFLDDDDLVDSKLLEEHLVTHQRYPGDNWAVLGYTGLDPAIADDPLMHFVTEVGCFLFSYARIHDASALDFEYFWGGRSSCKRSFLLEHGVFNPIFRFGCEDIELAYRLSKHDFRVMYNANAISTMVRKLDFDGFCGRLIRQGRSNFVFSRLHPEQAVQRWTELDRFDDVWRTTEPVYEETIRSARHLDRLANLKWNLGFILDEAETALLHRGYWAAFRAAKFKGIRESQLAAER